MLPTFVIGLREGVEASLIVGIIAAFLVQRGASRELRWVWIGVAAAVSLCVGAAVGLEILNQNLPQKQQEGLETVIAAVAVVMVTTMIVWMSNHAHRMRADLEEQADAAVLTGSSWALVAMAFLAVLREGLETSVFLLSAFQASNSGVASALGAVLGIGLALLIGFGIYRGGVKINLGRFFFVTGLVLVLVAAGLVAFAFHTAHEAGWVEFGQAQFIDLTWLVRPGSIQSALITGVLGIQPRPTVIEAVGWLLYFVPLTLFVWRANQRRRGSAPPVKAAPATTTT